jgi:hypothetical protein
MPINTKIIISCEPVFGTWYFILCHLIWHTSHLHKSPWISCTFMEFNINTVLLCTGSHADHSENPHWFSCSGLPNSWGLLWEHPSPAPQEEITADHSVRPHWLIHFSGKFSSSHRHTGIAKWSCAPYCIKIMFCRILPLWDTWLPLWGLEYVCQKQGNQGML